MTHYTTLIQRCRLNNSLLADELEGEFQRLERERDEANVSHPAEAATRENGDTAHLRVIAELYRKTWGKDAVNAGYIDWAADEIEKLRALSTHQQQGADADLISEEMVEAAWRKLPGALSPSREQVRAALTAALSAKGKV